MNNCQPPYCQTPLSINVYRSPYFSFFGADLSLQYNNGLTLLHAAAKNGNTSIIYELLSRGLDVDSRTNSGVTPLMNTASYDNESAFQMLIENGADIL